jgi:hypothetical protein
LTALSGHADSTDPAEAFGATFEAGVPKSLFPIAVTQAGHSFAVANDGQRFLVSASAGGERTVPMTIVLNWQARLKR